MFWSDVQFCINCIVEQWHNRWHNRTALVWVTVNVFVSILATLVLTQTKQRPPSVSSTPQKGQLARYFVHYIATVQHTCLQFSTFHKLRLQFLNPTWGYLRTVLNQGHQHCAMICHLLFDPAAPFVHFRAIWGSIYRRMSFTGGGGPVVIKFWIFSLLF